uniref:ATP synthase complex subunit 8 n=1 Tax=Hapalogenys analis TaxID=360505 RepID=A0A7M3UFI8_9TELE|nr:ATP synthase F0 subunit 8 [Hapalogenys analis]
MPQLNPTPWFTILELSWVVLLLILVPKIITHIFPNSPAPKSAEKPKTTAWTWPWH